MKNLSAIELINQAPGLIVIKDNQSIIQACSPLLAELSGFDSPEKILGLTDFDMRCDAVAGAEQFVLQDQYAIAHGEHLSLNIYTYADGTKVLMYGEKKAIKQNGEVVGLYNTGYDLTKSSAMANRFFSLLDNDGRFLSCDQQKAFSYVLSDGYEGESLTQAESLCFFYILRGKSNKEIAKILGLSFRTIDGRVESIKQKLCCGSKYQLIEYAHQKGYLSVVLKQLFTHDQLSLSLSNI